jgi:hypothetical protein
MDKGYEQTFLQRYTQMAIKHIKRLSTTVRKMQNKRASLHTTWMSMTTKTDKNYVAHECSQQHHPYIKQPCPLFPARGTVQP